MRLQGIQFKKKLKLPESQFKEFFGLRNTENPQHVKGGNF